MGPGKAAGSAANSLTKGSLKAALDDSLSTDSSDSDTDDNQVAANHKAGGSPLARLGIAWPMSQAMLAWEGDTGEGVTGMGPVPSVSLPLSHSMECCCRLLASLATAQPSPSTACLCWLPPRLSACASSKMCFNHSN